MFLLQIEMKAVFDIWCHNLDKFDVGGKVVKVDTTDFNAIDFNSCFESARQFLIE